MKPEPSDEQAAVAGTLFGRVYLVKQSIPGRVSVPPAHLNADTVTVTLSNSQDYFTIGISEYSGVSALAPIEDKSDVTVSSAPAPTAIADSPAPHELPHRAHLFSSSGVGWGEHTRSRSGPASELWTCPGGGSNHHHSRQPTKPQQPLGGPTDG
jgi:hypothetical protein